MSSARRWPIYLLAVGLAVAVLAFACGDDDGPEPTAPPLPSPGATATNTDPTPTPADQTETTPPTSPAPTATLPPPGPSTIIDVVPGAGQRIALTFDLGGRTEPALAIMAFLVDNQVHATIFVTGDIITRTTEGQQVIQTVTEHPELFVLANHSYFHPDFRDLSTAEIAEELQDTEAAIQALGGPDPRPWFRPPFGGYDQDVLDTVGELGYAYTVMWDFDSADWRPESDGGPDADGIVSKVLSNARAGSVVIFHLGGYHTLEALPAIVSSLRSDGYELVTLPELLQ